MRYIIKRFLIGILVIIFLLGAANQYGPPSLHNAIQSALHMPIKDLEQAIVEMPTYSGVLTQHSNISPIFTREVQYWGNDISRWAQQYELPPNLVAVVMQIESCGDPRALSSAGASGLFQVMPFHFQYGEDPFNPDTNAMRGMLYLQRSLGEAGGDIRLGLAGYNGGIGVISRSEQTWANETHRYVKYGAPIYFDAENGLSSSPSLDEWYVKYGARLCRQAAERIGISP